MWYVLICILCPVFLFIIRYKYKQRAVHGEIKEGVIKADDIMGVVRIKEELGSLLDGWDVVKLELDNKGYTCDYE